MLNGPHRDRQALPEGWTLYRFPGRSSDVQDEGSVEASYYTWSTSTTRSASRQRADRDRQHERRLPRAGDGKFVTLRVPYRMGFFAKWSEGRIDDPNAGWKGRGLWATSSDRTVFHNEGGTANRPQYCVSRCGPIRWRGNDCMAHRGGRAP